MTTPTPRLNLHTVDVPFGDCDPAGIVFFPNYLRWMDQASLAYFRACGLPLWRDLERERGILGTPLLELNTRFLRPASYGDRVVVHTTIEAWARKTFTHRHQVRRGDELLCEGTEVRCFAGRHPDDPARIQALPIPDDLRALCT